MKIAINSQTTTDEVIVEFTQATSNGFTHGNNGTKVFPLDAKSAKEFAGTDVEITFGVKLPGQPFEERVLAEGESASKPKAKPTKAKKEKPVKKAKAPKAKKAKVASGPSDTGFVRLIDDSLLETEPGKVDGFVRSKFTVDEVLARILKKFPDKVPSSVKKIIKVRPRHLEKRKDNDYNETTKRAPRWKIVGPGKNGSMTEIDSMFAKGKSTSEIVETLVTSHGRDSAKAKEVVATRVEFLKRQAKAAKIEAKAKK